MVKWLVTLFVVLAILAIALPSSASSFISPMRLGRLPGDLRIPLRGRVIYIPFTSTVLLSLALWALGKVI
jgi:hypothetical protein